VATCALGLELTVGRELEALGLGPIQRDNAQVSFPYTPEALAKANYWLRTADRVWLQLAEFPARDFEELFQGVKALDWPEMLPQDAHFPVEVISTKSQLESVSACQAVSKKAAVEKMQQVYGMSQFPETGARFAIRVFIVYDRARVFLDTSGEGLHRRGYRTYNAKAPLRETVAAALVLLSHWSPDRDLYDPMCGSATILLEAASIGLNRAAGTERSFASQRWKFLGRECWEQAHTEAMDLFDRRRQLRIFGSDNDGQVLKLARTHLEQSGLEGRGIYFQTRDVAEFSSQKKYGVMITNPPYGRRMSSEEEVAELTRTLASVFEPLSETWSLYYYTAFERFIDVYGRKPDRVRKIYNGRIAANFLQYPGPKPPNLGTDGELGGTPAKVKRIRLSP
jgi:putative N6-adenine-specific DNA methylase